MLIAAVAIFGCSGSKPWTEPASTHYRTIIDHPLPLALDLVEHYPAYFLLEVPNASKRDPQAAAEWKASLSRATHNRIRTLTFGLYEAWIERHADTGPVRSPQDLRRAVAHDLHEYRGQMRIGPDAPRHLWGVWSYDTDVRAEDFYALSFARLVRGNTNSDGHAGLFAGFLERYATSRYIDIRGPKFSHTMLMLDADGAAIAIDVASTLPAFDTTELTNSVSGFPTYTQMAGALRTPAPVGTTLIHPSEYNIGGKATFIGEYKSANWASVAEAWPPASTYVFENTTLRRSLVTFLQGRVYELFDDAPTAQAHYRQLLEGDCTRFSELGTDPSDAPEDDLGMICESADFFSNRLNAAATPRTAVQRRG